MFIGHVPASYLATTPVLDRAHVTGSRRRRLLWLGLIAGVFPDIDLFYFYLVDHRQHVHHAYLTHLPGFWIGILATAAAVLWLRGATRDAWIPLGIAGLNVMLHLALDTIAGGIRWLWPFSSAEFQLARVLRHYEPWYLNFFLHWTFAVEIGLAVAAVISWRRRAQTSTSEGVRSSGCS